MTNFKQARSNGKRGFNQKDPQPVRPTKAQRQAAEGQWEAAGFEMIDWNKMAYTWEGDFPAFALAPGTITDDQDARAGLVARYDPADIKILFPYGTPPAAIATRLDDEILSIMRHDADIDAPLDWEPVIVNGQMIGPEIDF
jgi:hypothetical protein